MDFERQYVLGATAACGELVGVAPMPMERGVGELGVSVTTRGRRRGIGLALARHALTEAKRAGAREFRFEYAADNDAMRHIAATLRMRLTRCGSEVSARLP
ncbi:MAG: GNAT family N-acetyltransferase [Burkholderiaceae bacterium]